MEFLINHFIILVYLSKLTIIIFIMIAYYHYIKSFLIDYSRTVARFLCLTPYFPKQDIEGAIELILIALSHMAFCFVLLKLMPDNSLNFGFFHLYDLSIFLSYDQYFQTLTLFTYSVLLGVGCMGLSGLLCKICIQLIQTFKPKFSYQLKTWLTFSRGGWIKHHLQSMQLLPLYVSLLILIMQVGSEEIIFRGIIFNYFMPFGKGTAFVTSIGLFVMMQAFLMHRWQSAIFPMIGALVMGIVHSILYIITPLLWPLVVAHISFFLFSII